MERLLEILREDARMSLEDIAVRLGMTIEEVGAHLTKMQEDGIILGYQAVIDGEKLKPRGVTALIEVRITPEGGGGFDRIAHRISQYDQVRSCYLMSGGYDLALMVEGKDLYDVARFVAEKLSTLDVVLSTATLFQLRVYKHDGFLLTSGLREDRLPISP